MARRKSSWFMAGSEGERFQPPQMSKGRRTPEARLRFPGEVVAAQVEHGQPAEVGRGRQGLGAAVADAVASKEEPAQVGQAGPRGQQPHTLVAKLAVVKVQSF